MDCQGQGPALVRVVPLVRLGVEPGVAGARGGLLDGVDLAGEGTVSRNRDALVLEGDLESDRQRLLDLADEGHALDTGLELRPQILGQVHADAVPVDARRRTRVEAFRRDRRNASLPSLKVLERGVQRPGRAWVPTETGSTRASPKECVGDSKAIRYRCIPGEERPLR